MNCLENLKKLYDIRFGRWNNKYKKKKIFPRKWGYGFLQ